MVLSIILKSAFLPVTIKKNGMLSSMGHLLTPQIPTPNIAMQNIKDISKVILTPAEKYTNVRLPINKKVITKFGL